MRPPRRLPWNMVICGEPHIKRRFVPSTTGIQRPPKIIRGEFRPIKTNVPGIEICELFPRMAAMMDKFIPVRSIEELI